MERRWYEWKSSLKAIEQEYCATRFAVDRLVTEARRDLGIVPKAIEIGHLTDAQRFLEGTYVVRLFREFETALRKFWVGIDRDTIPRMKDMVDGISSHKRIPFDISEHVHRVRKYRNNLVHERDDVVTPIPINEAGSRLSLFLRRMVK
jgi:hypothetical protein